MSKRYECDDDDNWRPEVQIRIGQSVMQRRRREDEQWRKELQELTEDPELDAEQLAQIAGCSPQYMRRLLFEANVGRLVNTEIGKGRRKRVVRLSELRELKEDFEFHRQLFGD